MSVTVTVMPGEKTVEVNEGVTLLEAIRAALPGALPKCDAAKGGADCHVFVQEGKKGLSKTSREENEILDTIVGVGSKSRLACYVTVLGTENVKVELLGEFSGL